MRLFFACEGNAETRDAWSGSAKSVLDGFRAAGHDVVTGDAELYHADRWLAAAMTYSPNRMRWGVRYRLAAAPFALRSRRASRVYRGQVGAVDGIFQIGATFEIKNPKSVPYHLYCDSNIRMAQRGADSGDTHASKLTAAELRNIDRREARIYAGATTILTISERLRRSFVEDFGIESSRVHTVHAGPNFDSGLLDEYANASERRRPHAPTILFVGRQFRRKGGETLRLAFRTVRSRIPDARLLVVGPDSLEMNEPGVECLGFLDKDRPDHRSRLLEAYASANVFCLPTRFEPFGIVFLEAMYFGLPCVGTDAWAVPEMITDGVTGFTVGVDDAEMLADRLIRLLTDSQLAQRMGAAGRARATSHFTWGAVIARMTKAMSASRRATALV